MKKEGPPAILQEINPAASGVQIPLSSRAMLSLMVDFVSLTLSDVGFSNYAIKFNSVESAPKPTELRAVTLKV